MDTVVWLLEDDIDQVINRTCVIIKAEEIPTLKAPLMEADVECEPNRKNTKDENENGCGEDHEVSGQILTDPTRASTSKHTRPSIQFRIFKEVPNWEI